nr:hypothetical protein [Tanacetum cinerariifolium]
ASASVTTAGVSISTVEPRTLTTTITTVFEDEDITISQTLVKMRSEKAKEKGVPFRDIQLDEELAKRLHEEEMAEFKKRQSEIAALEEAMNHLIKELVQLVDPKVNTSGSREDSMEHQEDLTDFVPPTPHDSPLSKDEAIKNVERDIVNTVGAVNIATTRVSVASASVTTAGVSISTVEPRTPPTTITTLFEDEDITISQTLVKMRSEKAKEKGVTFRDVEESARPTKILPTIDLKDKGKGIMQELEKPLKNLRMA